MRTLTASRQHTVALLGLLAWVPAAPVCAVGLAPFEPVAGCYIGAYIEMDPVAKDDIATFERLTGKKHASYFRYVGYGQPFPFQWAEKLKAARAMPHIAWEPNSGLDPVQDDQYLRGWAQACAHYEQPIFLRFASEMNGDWEAWSGNPELYVRKWRMVYDVIRRIAPNVIMVWCPFATPKSTIPLYYPGDEYVDWVGINVYSVVWHNGNTSRRAVEDALQHLAFVYGLYADRKPIAVCEYAATHYCEAEHAATTQFAIDKMRQLYESVRTRFPRVKMVNWFSVDTVEEGLAHNDYALTSDPMVLQAYRTLVASDTFLSTVQSPEMVAAGGEPGTMVTSGPGPVALPGAAQVPQPGAVPIVTGPVPVSQVIPRTTVPLALSEEASPAATEIAIVVRGGSPAALYGEVMIEAVLGPALQADRLFLYLDDRLRTATTSAPFSFRWNAATAPPGEHIIRAVAKDADGGSFAEAEASVIVAKPEG